jgi:tetratricopeptide (TPR) repeat protein
MRRAVVSFAFLAFAYCPMSVAQGLAGDPNWDTCLKAPTRACLLDEALIGALSVKPVISSQLSAIAEAQASAGNIQTALRIAHSIASDQRSRVTALASIARAQASLGLANDANETFVEARQLAVSLGDQLNRAEGLLSVGQAETDAGMKAEAVSAFAESLRVAEGLEIRASSSCVVFPSPEGRLDGLLTVIAERQARSGNLSDSLRTARSIKYNSHIRAEALRTIAEIQVQSGKRSEAGAILQEALEAVRGSQTHPDPWPSCPAMHLQPPSADFYADMLCAISRAQATAGQIDDAATTLEAALSFVPSIEDAPFWKAEVSRSLVLSAIAETQSELGLKVQSDATFERAKQAASEIHEPQHRITAFTRLARAQYKDGRVNDATGTFEEALALAQTLENAAERADRLLSILDAETELGLATDAETILVQALEATRSIPDKSRRDFTLRTIANAQVKAGRLQDGMATYSEALEALDTNDSEWRRTNSLFMIIRGWPGRPQDARLIAASAPQIVRIAASIDERRRAEALVVIAKALPN